MSDNRVQKFRARAVTMFHNPFAAWLILFTSLSFTVAAFYYSYQASLDVVHDRFEFRAEEVVHAIEARMQVYESVLRGTTGLFDASEFVSREEFRLYVESLDLKKHWPGVQGIGFSVPLQPDELDTHTKIIRAEGFKDYNVAPAGKRSEYSAIIYLEPFDWRNKRAFGYDMWSNEVRRTAMKRARDTGLPSMSGTITLVQETDEKAQKGFLTYLPLYRKGARLQTVEDRRAAFLGWVYAPFRAGDLMQGVLGRSGDALRFTIYNGTESEADSLMFASGTGKFDGSGFSKTKLLELQGRSWNIAFSAPQESFSGFVSSTPTYVAVAAGMIDLLLFYVIYSIQYLNRKANSIAGNMTAELKEKSLALQETKEELEHKLDDLKTAQAKLIESSNLAGLGEMAGGIAHEINNPLTIIYGYLDRLVLLSERNRLTPEDLTRIVGSAQKTVFRIRGIVNGLRNFSRDSQHESLSTTKIGEIIEETMDLCREKFKNNGVDLEITGDVDVEICCRKIQVSQVLVNLLNNAYHAVRDARIREIEISCEATESFLTLSVTDSGPGIPKDLVHKVFQPFFTTKEVGQGTGLGLSISKGLIESQNGSLEFDAASSRTRFVVRLPRTRPLHRSA